jgi:hypothetical protein
MWTEIISVIITLSITVTVGMLKPEWFMGWLLAFLNKKLPQNANKIENATGQKFIETGVYILTYNPDDEIMKNAVTEIEKQNTIIKDNLKKF